MMWRAAWLANAGGDAAGTGTGCSFLFNLSRKGTTAFEELRQELAHQRLEVGELDLNHDGQRYVPTKSSPERRSGITNTGKKGGPADSFRINAS